MNLKVDPARAALLVVDIQERLSAVMPMPEKAHMERNVLILIDAARRLGMPIVVSEQYPRGLGPTIAPVAEAVAAAQQGGADVRRMEKTEFACPDAGAWHDIWSALRREQWIVTGMEAHICVYQSARGLVGQGAAVQVVADAVISRTPENKAIGLGLAERAGAVLTSTEAVVFDALGRAGTEEFRALSKLIK